MNDLELLTRMRTEVPLLPPSADATDTLAAAIEQARTARPPRRRRMGRMSRKVIACSVAAAAGVAGGVIAVRADQHGASGPVSHAWSGRAGAPVLAGGPSVGRATTGTQLADFATRAAALGAQRGPGPHDWIFVKIETADSSAGGGGFLFGPPDERQIGLQWIRADWKEWASAGSHHADLPAPGVAHGKLSINPGGPFGLGGWKSVAYDYLNSLPTDPARLRAVILSQNSPKVPWYQPNASVAVFSAIVMLLEGQCEGVWIPPRLAAAMYRLLEQTPGVRFDSAADLAGRTGLGFYMVIGGWYKQEVVINPLTYTYMGDEVVAVRNHESEATDGNRLIGKGQVLGWEALLAEAIVQHPGQIP